MAEHYHGPTAIDEELVHRLAEVQCLTLIVLGTEDGLVPAETGRLLKRSIASSYLSYIFDAAHVIEIDQPERFGSLSREFLVRAEAFIINWNDEP